MTTPVDPVDELVSAYLDGEATPRERRQVESDPVALARLEQFRAARQALGAPVTVPDDVRARQVAAAIDAADWLVDTAEASAAQPERDQVRDRVKARRPWQGISLRGRWPGSEMLIPVLVTAGVLALVALTALGGWQGFPIPMGADDDDGLTAATATRDDAGGEPTSTPAMDDYGLEEAAADYAAAEEAAAMAEEAEMTLSQPMSDDYDFSDEEMDQLMEELREAQEAAEQAEAAAADAASAALEDSPQPDSAPDFEEPVSDDLEPDTWPPIEITDLGNFESLDLLRQAVANFVAQPDQVTDGEAPDESRDLGPLGAGDCLDVLDYELWFYDVEPIDAYVATLPADPDATEMGSLLVDIILGVDFDGEQLVGYAIGPECEVLIEPLDELNDATQPQE